MVTIRVLIVDDVEQVRRDLRTLLTLVGGIEIVGEAANGVETLQMAKTLFPEVVLMDLEMPVMDGYEATRQIKETHPDCRVIALSIHAGEMERQRALQSGVDAFVVKGAALGTLLDAIHNTPTYGRMPKGEKK